MSEVSKTVFSKGTLFDLDISRWGAIKKMSEKDLLMNDVDQNALYLGHKKLLPKKATEDLIRVEGEARSYLIAHSMAFPIAGARFVSFRSLAAVTKKLKILQAEFQGYVDKLVAEYNGLKESQIKVLDEQALGFMRHQVGLVNNSIQMDAPTKESEKAKLADWYEDQKKQHRSFYPTAEELTLKYKFDWRVFKLSPVDQAEAIDPEALAIFQEKYEKDIENWAKEAATMMHKALGEAAAQAKAMLEKQGKLNPKNLKPLFDAFDTFKSVDFTGKSSFQKVVDDMKAKYWGAGWKVAAEAINATEASKNEFSELLGAIGQLALDETAHQAALEALEHSDFGRVIDLS